MAKQADGRRRTGSLVALAVGAAAVWAAREIPAAMGARASGERAERVERSPQFADGKFHNTVPASQVTAGSAPRLIGAGVTNRVRPGPAAPIPVVQPLGAGQP